MDVQFKLQATGYAWDESLRNMRVMLGQHLENGRVSICCDFPSEAITNVTRHVIFDREHNWQTSLQITASQPHPPNLTEATSSLQKQNETTNLIVAPCIFVESLQFINQRMHI